ncbi:heavy-metal-associated domain-containing protein [Mycobacterium asiaticum]|uniref:Heavy metal transporter n=1 Tax=Mycobacterium asiaticum TaxID=1790 RepID=A0A1A3IFS9_MYCAS|nr:heavy-metal-associated domain-containing protein [Mycobacterium asiaticum]OBI90930.1 heavy metal transporter [Mycobacterium asiaticum]OBJ59442.1 heavy metal transporter [Mycobacterium asiaticum]OBJ82000.1 heavy metal transporter [Mycobacterium asiaticum]ORA14721.1 heavy metal transporter [Mycobacterium asiaticum DSM 44297]
MAEQTFSVDGLHCQGCVDTITTALTALRPVSAVRIELNTEGASAVHVSSSAELSPEQVQAALKGEGNFNVLA